MKTLILLVLSSLLFSASQKKAYKCTPCGRECDKVVYKKKGTCNACKMPLVKASTITFRSIPPGTICEYIKQNPGTILLDVRTAAEFEGKAGKNYGSLKNALNIPVEDLEKRIAELSAYKNKEIIVYCARSHRSPAASYILSQKGFTNVVNLEGGMSAVSDEDCKTKRD